MNFRSYAGKVFVVESSKAIIRDEKLKELKYKSGEDRPPGKRIGDERSECVLAFGQSILAQSYS